MGYRPRYNILQMRDKLLIFLFSGLLSGISVQAGTSLVHRSDQGNGYYTNPVLHADYSDPDVVRVGDDYYMTASSFNCIPGIPILHSKDLVNWNLINYALPQQAPVDFFDKPQHGKGVWAPCIRHHDGTYYIFWGDPDFGIYVITTTDPAGNWSKPRLLKEGKGMIDPTPLWDEDGKAYIGYAWAASRAGINSIIVVSEMTPDATSLIGNPVMVFDGNEGANHTVEGPKLYKRNGYYYIFAPAGGVAHGWQLAMRSSSVFGPYEPRIVMAQGKTDINGPHQGAWVDTSQGEDWFIHFQDKGAYGRIIHLNPVAWVSDWPVIGNDPDGDGCGDPVTTWKKPATEAPMAVATPPDSDEFDSRHLGLQWSWHANYQPTYGFTTDMGFMRLYAHRQQPQNLWDVPSLLLQKFMAEEFTATTKLSFSSKAEGEKAGLLVMGWDYAYLALERKGETFELQQVSCTDAELKNPESIRIIRTGITGEKREGGNIPSLNRDIWLRVQVKAGAICSFSYSLDGRKFVTTDIPFKARQGKWIGAKLGLFALNPNLRSDSGWVDCDWFRITKK